MWVMEQLMTCVIVCRCCNSSFALRYHDPSYCTLAVYLKGSCSSLAPLLSAYSLTYCKGALTLTPHCIKGGRDESLLVCSDRSLPWAKVAVWGANPMQSWSLRGAVSPLTIPILFYLCKCSWRYFINDPGVPFTSSIGSRAAHNICPAYVRERGPCKFSANVSSPCNIRAFLSRAASC